MDKARQKTDKQLKVLESRIGKVYKNDLALLRIKERYYKYMAQVSERTEGLYLAYKNASDEEKAEAKKAYTEAVRELTEGNKEYRAIIRDLVRAIAGANQRALDEINAEMLEVYVENYNQVAEDCRKVGIEVNGEA